MLNTSISALLFLSLDPSAVCFHVASPGRISPSLSSQQPRIPTAGDTVTVTATASASHAFRGAGPALLQSLIAPTFAAEDPRRRRAAHYDRSPITITNVIRRRTPSSILPSHSPVQPRASVRHQALLGRRSGIRAACYGLCHSSRLASAAAPDSPGLALHLAVLDLFSTEHSDNRRGRHRVTTLPAPTSCFAPGAAQKSRLRAETLWAARGRRLESTHAWGVRTSSRKPPSGSQTLYRNGRQPHSAHLARSTIF